MPPVGAFIATLVASGSIAAATTAFALAGGWAVVGTFVLTQAALFGVSKLLAGRQNKSRERQGDTTSLSLGENPREAILGRCATGGQLVDCWNHDSGSGEARINRAEVLVIKLADHECEALEGFYVGDEYHSFTGDGTVPAFDIPGFGWGLQVWWRNGAVGQTPPDAIVSTSNGMWDADKKVTGCAYVIVRYADRKDRTIWPSGRPQFLWVVKGAKLYDPRKDSTVAGGSGAHRWGDPSTHEWSDNAYLCRYNWVRGIFNRGGATPHLMVGRGLTAEEAPPERAIGRANICDEAVDLKSGGTEKRYRAGGVIKSTDQGIDVEEWFAIAMGGDVVDRDGVVDIDPGEAKSTVIEITDADLLVGEPITFNRYLSENQRCNTVVARFIDPAQRWEDVSAPMRRDYADVIADGKPYENPLDLLLVQSNTQAQRIAEIRRRQARLERSGSVPLGPRFVGLETGDWIGWTSDRFLGGERAVFAVTGIGIDEGFRVFPTLRETAASVFGWDADVDEKIPGAAPAESMPAPDAIVVEGFDAVAASVTGDAGSVPGIWATWDEPADPAVTGYVIQVRKDGETAITPTTVRDPDALSALVTAGVGPVAEMNVRMRATTNTNGRVCVWTSWQSVTAGNLDAGTVGGITPGEISDALSDGVFSVREKQRFVPIIHDLIDGETALVAQAVAAGVSSSAYEAAILALSDFLDEVDDPVDWDDTSDKSLIDGEGFMIVFDDAMTARRDLQAAIMGGVQDQIAGIEPGGGVTVIGDDTPGTLGTLDGTSWLTVDSGTTPALPPGQLVAPYLSYLGDGGFLTMDVGTMDCEARLVIGTQVIEVVAFQIVKFPLDPVEIVWTSGSGFSAAFVALTGSGALPYSLEVRRLSGPASASNLVGLAKAKLL